MPTALSQEDEPVHVVDWGRWPKWLKFTKYRFTEINSANKWNEYEFIKLPRTRKYGAYLYYLHHSGRYVPYGFLKPSGRLSNVRNDHDRPD